MGCLPLIVIVAIMLYILIGSEPMNVRRTLYVLFLFLCVELQTAVLVRPGVVHGGTLSDCMLCSVGDALDVSR